MVCVLCIQWQSVDGVCVVYTVAIKMEAQRETSCMYRQLKEHQYTLREALDDANHAKRMQEMANTEATDLRAVLEGSRKELHLANAHLRSAEDKAVVLESWCWCLFLDLWFSC